MHCAVHIGTNHRAIGIIILTVYEGAVLVATAEAVVIDTEHSAVVCLVVVTGWTKGGRDLDAWHIMLLNRPRVAKEYDKKDRDRHSVVREKPSHGIIEAGPCDCEIEPHRANKHGDSCARV